MNGTQFSLRRTLESTRPRPALVFSQFLVASLVVHHPTGSTKQNQTTLRGPLKPRASYKPLSKSPSPTSNLLSFLWALNLITF